MDQQLLEELYGTTEAEATEEDLIKEAQAELIEAVADEAGIDLNTLDDEELDKFAEYVLTPEEGEAHQDPNLATADAMGRQMAQSYADEQIKIASQLQGEQMIDEVLLEKAAEWDLAKEAAKDKKMIDRTPREMARGAGAALKRGAARARSGLSRATGFRDLKRARELSKQLKSTKEVAVPTGRSRFALTGKSMFRRPENMVPVSQMQRRERAYNIMNPQDPGSISSNQAKAMRQARKARAGRMVRGADIKSYQDYKDAVRARRGLAIRGGAKALASLGATAGVAYGAKRLMDKKSSFQGYEDEYYDNYDYDLMDKQSSFQGYEDEYYDEEKEN